MIFTIHSKKYGDHKVEIDDEDVERVLKYKWYVGYNYRNRTATTIHAVATRIYKDKKGTIVYLHRFLLPNETIIDHIDGNPLNNKKSNLRACTNAENLRNRGKTRNNKSGYKGVSWSKDKKKWHVQIRVNNKVLYLKRFETKEDAARAYNKAAKKYHGKFARLNIIKDTAL